jgi:hypothetical protein
LDTSGPFRRRRWADIDQISTVLPADGDDGGMLRAAGLLCSAVLLTGVAGCGAGEPDESAMPRGVHLEIDQTRLTRMTRQVFIRVHNDGTQAMSISGFTLRSPRFDATTWTGRESVGPGQQADLELTMPPTRCGGDLDATVRLTYRLGDSDERVSTAPAVEPYETIRLLMERDCARSTLAKVARLEVGTPQVVGRGSTSVLRVPVTLTPTGTRDDVRFGGYESTPLFRQAPGSPVDVDEPIDRAAPSRIDMSVVPARCDAHALADDKVGRLFGLRVIAPDLPDGSFFYLPLDKAQRVAFFDYFRARCGLG